MSKTISEGMMWHTGEPYSILPLFLFMAMNLCGLFTVPACAIEKLSDEQAIAIANKEIAKFNVDPSGWKVSLDKSGDEWVRKRRSWEDYLKSTSVTWPRDRIAEIEMAMKGKDIWLVVYDRLVPPGKRILHTHAIVFLDSKAGNILAVINPEE